MSAESGAGPWPRHIQPMATMIILRRTPASPLTTLLALVLLAACSDTPAPGDAGGAWEFDEEHLGDTTVVRTLSGSVWGDSMRLEPDLVLGELDGADPYVFGQIGAVDRDARGRLYVADRQAAEVRVFSPDGEFIRVIGARGEGPGEYSEPDDLRITPQGELVVRDQRGARFLVYSLDGEHLRSWRLSGTFFTSEGFYLTDHGHVLNPDLNFSLPMDAPDRTIHVAFDVESGTVVDSLPRPQLEEERAVVELTQESEGGVSRMMSAVPFHPSGIVGRTPSGGVLRGLGSRYALTLEEPGGTVLRIERAAPPEPVQPAERRVARSRIEDNFRDMDASWQWNGPPIPETKPPFRWAGFGPDGALWVLRHTRAEERENPDYDPDGPSARRQPTEWFEPPVMDVFDAEGRYLGPIRMPDGFRTRGWMVLDPDEPVLVVSHELGYDQVVRYRRVPATPE